MLVLRASDSALQFRAFAPKAQPHPAKLEPIRKLPSPLYICKDVQKFLGLPSYCRNFIPGFTRSAVLPTSILKQDNQFIWMRTEEETATSLFGHLTPYTVLILPEFIKHST